MNLLILIKELFYFLLRQGRQVAFFRKRADSLEGLLRHATPSGCISYGALESTYRFGVPRDLRTLRSYFRRSGKGFGEDALFAMWWLLLESVRPKKMLEIGVYRGQVLAFWSKWARRESIEAQLYGLSPFTAAGDEVSTYDSLDYLGDIQSSFGDLELPMFEPLVFLSTDSRASEVLEPHFGTFDLVYVDGSHNYDVVLNDIALSHLLLRQSGYMVLDDAGLNIPQYLPPYAFKGHPGPSRAASELLSSQSWKFVACCGHNLIFCRV